MASCDIVSFLLEHAEYLMATYVYVENPQELLCENTAEMEAKLPLAARTRCGTSQDLVTYTLTGKNHLENNIELTKSNISTIVEILDKTGFISVSIDSFTTFPPNFIERLLKYRDDLLKIPDDEYRKQQRLSQEFTKYVRTHDEDNRTFPGHTFAIIRNENKEYVLLQSYILQHSIRGYSLTRDNIVELLHNYVALSDGLIFTKEDEKLWLMTTGSQLEDVAGRSMVGYMKHYQAVMGWKNPTRTKGYSVYVNYDSKELKLDSTCMQYVISLLTTALVKITTPPVLVRAGGVVLGEEHKDDTYERIFGSLPVPQYIAHLATLIKTATELLTKKFVIQYTYSEAGLAARLT